MEQGIDFCLELISFSLLSSISLYIFLNINQFKGDNIVGMHMIVTAHMYHSSSVLSPNMYLNYREHKSF